MVYESRNKHSLVRAKAFASTSVVLAWDASLHVTFGGNSGIMTTARLKLSYSGISQAKFRELEGRVM